ncbi:hypothetical protein [Nonomuraea sp. NPDC005650]|uniref:hypothetical protein n=1 Tax=Nonomuraea sp. NPDC005650 TaxID=3157045 RepID=UPI0033A0E42F
MLSRLPRTTRALLAAAGVAVLLAAGTAAYAEDKPSTSAPTAESTTTPTQTPTATVTPEPGSTTGTASTAYTKAINADGSVTVTKTVTKTIVTVETTTYPSIGEVPADVQSHTGGW